MIRSAFRLSSLSLSLTITAIMGAQLGHPTAALAEDQSAASSNETTANPQPLHPAEPQAATQSQTAPRTNPSSTSTKGQPAVADELPAVTLESATNKKESLANQAAATQ